MNSDYQMKKEDLDESTQILGNFDERVSGLEKDEMARIKETRKKLHYMSAVSRTKPVAKIPVNRAKMEELDRSIREKARQNHLMDHNISDDGFYYRENKSQQVLVLKKTRK